MGTWPPSMREDSRHDPSSSGKWRYGGDMMAQVPMSTSLRAMVICPRIPKTNSRTQNPPHSKTRQVPERETARRLAEAVGLARAISLSVVATATPLLRHPHPGTLFGPGKVAEIRERLAAENIGLAIVDHPLSPIQQRNLERAWQVKVLDRTGLILEIFGERASTAEGRLQVELAHLTYQKSRLVRSWTHLERQRGGFGFLGGPGETQIEADRRMIQARIDVIRRELTRVTKTRALHRKGRKRVPHPVVALVGYTNAGKSTLFNRLTGAHVREEDMLFATLDPTMREARLPSGLRIILSDTVGFISDLPTMLVAAFRATLEEVTEADLILHVRDISAPDTEAQRQDVVAVLASLGIDEEASGERILEVWNKMDLLAAEDALALRNQADRVGAVCVSAIEEAGLTDLLAALDRRLTGHHTEQVLEILPADGAVLAWLHENADVLTQEMGKDGTIRCRVRLSPQARGRLATRLAKTRSRILT